MAKRKHTRKLLKTFTEYGIHIWAILIIANAALVYAFNFSVQADKEQDSPIFVLDESPQDVPEEELTPTEEPEPAEPTTPPKPKGPVLNLVFTVPGIGSGGGTLKPRNLKRTLTVYLYEPDANSLNPTVKPLYTIKGTADFDTNPDSPTYTSFVSRSFDLGSTVKEGEYQIAISTDQSLRTVIRESPDNIGGQRFTIRNVGSPPRIPSQRMNMGDILPEEGDNVVDISDYNAFVNCYGDRTDSDFCQGRNYGDFDDNGIVDGIDYNIMIRSFSNILKQGQSIPQLSIVPSISDRVATISTPTPTETPPEPTSAPTEAVAETQSSGSGGAIIGGILFLLFLIIMGAIGFILYKKNEKVRTMIKAVIHMSPTGKPGKATDPNAAPAEGETAAPAEEPVTETTDQAQPADAAQPAAAATEPVPDPATQEATAESPAPAALPAQPVEQPAAPAAGQEITKDAYVKVKGADEAGAGQWLLLTDDNGPVEAHYAKNDAQDGFAKVKGVMKTENGKTFLEISELAAEG